eukprot:GILK01011023.1.p1 GENE.GILK01011023.1~~GILK01011023.1.p1  ORF type:complete len:490 (+),score=72.99 GILK01011023.1:49-1470(+)
MSSSSRKRLFKACLPCHQSKLSCDEGRPCQRCLKRGDGSQCVEYAGIRRVKRRCEVVQLAERQLQTTVPKSVAVVRKSSFPIRHITGSEAQQYVFGTLLFAFHEHLASDLLVDPVIASTAARMYQSLLTREQVDALLHFVSMHGDDRYRQEIAQVKHSPALTFKPLADVWASPDHYIFEQRLMTPSQLDFMPLPTMYAVLDPQGKSMYVHLNSKMQALIGLPSSSIHELFLNGYTEYDFMKALIDPTVFCDTYREWTKNFVSHSKHFSISTRIRTGQGRITKVRFTVSVTEHPRVIMQVISPLEGDDFFSSNAICADFTQSETSPTTIVSSFDSFSPLPQPVSHAVQPSDHVAESICNDPWAPNDLSSEPLPTFYPDVSPSSTAVTDVASSPYLFSSPLNQQVVGHSTPPTLPGSQISSFADLKIDSQCIPEEPLQNAVETVASMDSSYGSLPNSSLDWSPLSYSVFADDPQI